MSVTTHAGKLPQQRYPSLGFQGIRMVHPPDKLFGLICGLPGEGKSQFAHSHPDAWVCNMDSTSTLGNPRAIIWPGINAQGQAIDIEIQAREILFLKDTLNGLMAEHTGQPLEKIAEDTDRDYFLSPAEAVEYGLIDRVVHDSVPSFESSPASDGGSSFAPV